MDASAETTCTIISMQIKIKKTVASNYFQNKFQTGIVLKNNSQEKTEIRIALSCNSGFYTLGNYLIFSKTSAFLHAVQPSFTSVKSLHVFMISLILVSYENANFGSNTFCRAEGELAKHILEMSSVLEVQDLLPSAWQGKKTKKTKKPNLLLKWKKKLKVQKLEYKNCVKG